MVLVNRYIDDKGDLFLKFFLIDSSENNRRWRTTDAANEAYARTAIGTPFTLMLNKQESKYGDFHPFLPNPEAPVKDQIDFAFKYAIGQIVDVSKDSEQYKAAGYAANNDSPWFATVKITDPMAKEEFQKPDTRLIPKAVSPGIIHLSGPDDAITEYHIVHLAAVPEGAYGPRAIKWASCNGDALSCIPKLKAASYKERTNCCVLESLSSLAQKSASSDIIMSAVNSTPGPQTFGTGTIETTTPSSTNNQNQQQQQQPSKPTIRIRKQKQLSEEEEENPEGQQENNGENPNPNQTEANPADQSFKSSRYYGELQSLKKELQNRTQQWDEREKRYQLEKIIPPQLFTDSRGRFNQKAWESEIQRAMKESASMELLAEYYATKLQAMQLPELKATGAPTRRASSISMKSASASSQNIDDEEQERRMKLAELGKMIRGQR